MTTCQACQPKGPGWPWYLDVTAHQKICPWCNGTQSVTIEVAEVYARLSQDPGLVNVRANTLMARALEAKSAWEQLRPKKRPKGHSEKDWEQHRSSTQYRAEQAEKDAIEAREIWAKTKQQSKQQ